MDRVYQSNAIGTPPSAVASSGAYPTAGNKASGQLATVPGAYWFYSVTEEIRNAIIQAGITPDPAKINQLATALAKFLPLAGGKMEGAIKFASDGAVARDGTTNYLGLFGSGTAWWDNGANLCLYGVDHANNGQFAMTAIYKSADGTLSKAALTGKGDGTLTWSGSRILTVATGLQLSGGTMSGVITTSNTVAIRKSSDDSFVRVYGGSDYTKGAYLRLDGQTGERSGGFRLAACNGSSTKYIDGTADGSLAWDGHSINHYINPSSTTSLPVDGTESTIPLDGWIYLSAQRNSSGVGEVAGYVNGAYFIRVQSNNYSYAYIPIPVKKGDKFKAVQKDLSWCAATFKAFV